MLLKFAGTTTLVVSSYHNPKPLSASCFHGKVTFGSFFLVGAISACPIKFAVGIECAFFSSASKFRRLLICCSVKGSKPLLSISIPIEDEFTSVRFPHLETPACHARK